MRTHLWAALDGREHGWAEEVGLCGGGAGGRDAYGVEVDELGVPLLQQHLELAQQVLRRRRQGQRHRLTSIHPSISLSQT